MSDSPDGPVAPDSAEPEDPQDEGAAEDGLEPSEEPPEASDDGAERTPPAVSDIKELAGGATGEMRRKQGVDAEGSDTPEVLEETDEERNDRLKSALESLVFVTDRVATPQTLGRILKIKAAEVRALMAELVEAYRDRGIQLIEVSGGYQFRSSPRCAEYVRSMVAQRPVRLTRAQLETLALVVYRQPITRPEVDEVRGVDTGSAIKVLLERGLIKMLGRKDEAGRPMVYGTTAAFLEFFGLNSLRDLPTLREFTELSEESRTLFKRKTGSEAEDVEAELSETVEDQSTLADLAADFADKGDGPDLTEGDAADAHQEEAASADPQPDIGDAESAADSENEDAPAAPEVDVQDAQAPTEAPSLEPDDDIGTESP